MTISNEHVHRVVYVIIGWSRRLTNDRVAKVLRLRPEFHRMVLVVRGSEPSDEEVLAVRAIPNPLSLLRRIGLNGLCRFLERLLFFPNAHVLYTRVAKQRLQRMVRSDLASGRDVTVMTCVPNHENTSIGLYLKKRFPDIHWVVDWQDLWSYDDNYYGRVFPLYRGLLRRRERKVLERADLNVTTNSYAERVLRDVYAVPESRLAWIPHHFDPADLPDRETSGPAHAADEQSKLRTVTIGFLGSLFKPPRVPGLQFLQVLRKLRASGVDVELHLHGPLPPGMSGNEPSLLEAGLVIKPGIANHEFVSVLGQYDYLLILLADLPNSRAVMSIKLPHYLISGSRVLAVVPRTSAVADIVRRTRAGIVVASDGDWQQELEAVLKRHPARRSERADLDTDAIEEFSWTRTSGRWINALRPVTARASPRPPAATMLASDRSSTRP